MHTHHIQASTQHHTVLVGSFSPTAHTGPLKSVFITSLAHLTFVGFILNATNTFITDLGVLHISGLNV